MGVNWVLTDGAYETYNAIAILSNKETGMEVFYVRYMKEILKRNLYNSFYSELKLECYGSSIIDAINHSAIEIINSNDIKRENIAEFEFTSEENKQLQQEMLKFYDGSKAYIEKMKKQ